MQTSRQPADSVHAQKLDKVKMTKVRMVQGSKFGGAHQVRVVLLVVLSKGGGHGHHEGAVGGQGEDAVVEGRAESQKVAQLVLRAEQVLRRRPSHHIGRHQHLPPRQVLHCIGHHYLQGHDCHHLHIITQEIS